VGLLLVQCPDKQNRQKKGLSHVLKQVSVGYCRMARRGCGHLYYSPPTSPKSAFKAAAMLLGILIIIGLLSRVTMGFRVHAQLRMSATTTSASRRLLGTAAEWRQWLPVRPPSTSGNGGGGFASGVGVWREWMPRVSSVRHSSGSGEQGEVPDDEWRHFEFGTFASHQGPTKQQVRQIEKLAGMSEANGVEDPLWSHLTDEDVAKGIAAVGKYVTRERREKFDKILGQRTDFVRFVFEDPINLNNVWACLRTFDAFGLQYTSVIAQEESYHTAWRKQTMMQAMGAQKWLTLKQETSSVECLRRLKSQGYRIVASALDPSPSVSVSAYDVDWTSQQSAIVLGNEMRGISDAVRAEADILFHLPMKGFAESLNVSAFSAALCGVLNQRGALSPSHSSITDAERQRIMLTWMCRTAPSSLDVMRREGINAGNRLWESVGGFTTRP